MTPAVWVPWLVGIVVAGLGIPVARWLARATYRKPDEWEDPLPGNRWWVPAVLGVCAGLVVHRVWFVADPPESSPWSAAMLTATLLLVVLSGVCLAAMDLDVHRLPDRIVWPTMGLVLGGLTLAALVGGGLEPWLRSLLGGLAGGGLYLLLALVALARGSLALGLGDVKLAAVLGFVLGWFGWTEFMVGIYAGFLVGGLAAVVLLLARRVRWEGHIAFGPAMMVGALIGMLAGPGLLSQLF